MQVNFNIGKPPTPVFTENRPQTETRTEEISSTASASVTRHDPLDFCASAPPALGDTLYAAFVNSAQKNALVDAARRQAEASCGFMTEETPPPGNASADCPPADTGHAYLPDAGAVVTGSQPDEKIGPGRISAEVGLPRPEKNTIKRLKEITADSRFSKILAVISRQEVIGILEYAFRVTEYCNQEDEFERLKGALLLAAGDDQAAVGQVLKNAVWDRLLTMLPGSQARPLREAVQAAQQQLENGGSYADYLQANRLMIESVRARDEPEALIEALDRGEKFTPADLACVFMRIIDEKAVEIIQQMRPGDPQEKLRSFFMNPSRVSESLIERCFSKHAEFFENTINALAERIIDRTGPKTEIELQLHAGMARFNRLFTILKSPGADPNNRTYKQLALLQACTRNNLQSVMRSSHVMSQDIPQLRNHPGWIARRKKESTAFYARAADLMPDAESRMMLRDILGPGMTEDEWPAASAESPAITPAAYAP